MTPNECINLMCAFYKEPAYEDMGTKKVKNVRVEEARTFLKRLPGSMLDRFWIEITKKFLPTATVPFPTPAHLSDIWNDLPDTGKGNVYSDSEKIQINVGKEMSIKEISDRIDEYRKQDRITNSQGDFISVWDHVATIWGLMWEHKMDMDRIFAYCEKLKERIIAGERVDITAACEKMFGKKKSVEVGGMSIG